MVWKLISIRFFLEHLNNPCLCEAAEDHPIVQIYFEKCDLFKWKTNFVWKALNKAGCYSRNYFVSLLSPSQMRYNHHITDV